MFSLEKEYITNYNSLLFPLEWKLMTAEEHMEVNIYTDCEEMKLNKYGQ